MSWRFGLVGKSYSYLLQQGAPNEQKEVGRLFVMSDGTENWFLYQSAFPVTEKLPDQMARYTKPSGPSSDGTVMSVETTFVPFSPADTDDDFTNSNYKDPRDYVKYLSGQVPGKVKGKYFGDGNIGVDAINIAGTFSGPSDEADGQKVGEWPFWVDGQQVDWGFYLISQEGANVGYVYVAQTAMSNDNPHPPGTEYWVLCTSVGKVSGGSLAPPPTARYNPGGDYTLTWLAPKPDKGLNGALSSDFLFHVSTIGVDASF
jgi:hypothetical protein